MSGNGRLRSADELVAPAVAETVAHLDLHEADRAAVRLAERLAREIDGLDPTEDGPGAVEKLSARLLAVLEALGATPRARAAVLKAPTPGAGKLQALRAARSS